jgi:transposase
MGTSRFDQAARAASRHDDVLYLSVNALLEALGAIEAQIAALDKAVGRLCNRACSHSGACWRLMSVPGVGPVTALAFEAAIEDPSRFRRSRDVGAYLGLTPRRYQSGDRDVSGGISKQGDAMARHCLYEAANCILTTWSGRSALKSWGSKLVKRVGAKKARVAFAGKAIHRIVFSPGSPRKLACLLLRLWKDNAPYEGDLRTA